MDGSNSVRVLIRTTCVDAETLAFADQLQAASGHPVALVVDARHTPDVDYPYPTVRLSQAACEAMGLYCPKEFAWQCGDYGYYLARRQFPEAKTFWMIENDVRFYGGEPGAFFRFFDQHEDTDFLATGLTQTDRTWHWTATARGRKVKVYRCLFPVTRLSARAVDAAFARRLDHSRRPLRRRLWPNDEALVATTLVNGDFVGRDFNAFGSVFYEKDTFSFHNPIDGDQFNPTCPTPHMYHPVLFGPAYHAKVERLQKQEKQAPWLQRKLRRAMSEVAGLTPW